MAEIIFMASQLVVIFVSLYWRLFGKTVKSKRKNKVITLFVCCNIFSLCVHMFLYVMSFYSPATPSDGMVFDMIIMYAIVLFFWGLVACSIINESKRRELSHKEMKKALLQLENLETINMKEIRLHLAKYADGYLSELDIKKAIKEIKEETR